MELYYLEGFKTREIAGMLGISENTVKTRLRAAREYFAQGLERSVLRMMNHNDFPKMTEEFDRSVRRALDSLPERESKPVRRFSAKKIVCAGLAAALCIGGTAFAANAQSWFPLLFPNGGDANLEGMCRRRTMPS